MLHPLLGLVLLYEPSRGGVLRGYMQEQTSLFLDSLHRGGSYAYLWTPTQDGHGRTYSYRIGRGLPVLRDTDIYFGVNPVGYRLGTRERGTNNGVVAVSCFFGDFDGKDFVPIPTDLNLEPLIAKIVAGMEPKKAKVAKRATLEYRARKLYQKQVFLAEPKIYLALAATHIKKLSVPPSYVVWTGGGYHVYWIFDEPFITTTEEARSAIARDLRSWVSYIGSDAAASDLNRVLRVPGTYNHKYDPPIHTGFAVFEPDRKYSLRALRIQMMSLFDGEPTPAKTCQPVPSPTGLNGREYAVHVIKAFNAQHSVEDILLRNGYRQRNDSNRWYRPDGKSASVRVQNGRSYHHSSSDALYHGNYSGSGAHDAYSLFTELEHGGDRKQALCSAASELGLFGRYETGRPSSKYKAALVRI